jgi:uncharacterized membrane protein
VFGYVSQRTSFYLSAAFGILGAAVTWLFLPDTTGMSLDELDRWGGHSMAMFATSTSCQVGIVGVVQEVGVAFGCNVG